MLLRSPTGTGKTLAYAVPVVQALQALNDPRVSRSDGPVALVLTPTRELAAQSFEVFQQLLSPYRWVVPGMVIGGEKKKSEKARLRKGLNVIVATPGRLLDHIKTTQCLNFEHLRFLVLDEADRMTDAGFEEDLTAILSALELQAKTPRINIMLSATLTDSVQKLAALSLRNPAIVDTVEGSGAHDGSGDALVSSLPPSLTPRRGSHMPTTVGTLKDLKDASATSIGSSSGGDGTAAAAAAAAADAAAEPSAAVRYTLPAKLRQHFCIVPAKQRLVSLLSFLREKCQLRTAKALVFVASRNEAVFYEELLTGDGGSGNKVKEKKRHSSSLSAAAAGTATKSVKASSANIEALMDAAHGKKHLRNSSGSSRGSGNGRLGLGEEEVDDGGGGGGGGGGVQDDGLDLGSPGPVLGNTPLYFLHGGMAQGARTKSFFAFCRAPKGVLFCTDVAARGLDFPHVSWILQTSAPASVAEYVHRCGRTARLDQAGSALLLLLPTEGEFLNVLSSHALTASAVTPDDMWVCMGQGAEGRRAGVSRLQMQLENRVLMQDGLIAAARAAFIAYVRSYSTYPKAVKHIFHPKRLHLGHLSKSFALRETPAVVHTKDSKAKVKERLGPDGKAKPKPKKAGPAARMKRAAKSQPSEFAGGGSLSGPRVKRKKKRR